MREGYPTRRLAPATFYTRGTVSHRAFPPRPLHSREMERTGREPVTLAAFAGSTLAGGINMVAVRVSDRGLDPFWGATLRFALAAAVVLAIARLRRLTLPRGRAFRVAVAYGIVNFGVSFALFYWGVVRVPAGRAGVIIATTPLLAFLLTVAHGVERFRWRGLAGAAVALAGVVAIFAERAGGGVPLASFLAILASAVCAAESAILLKRAPECDPITMNAAAMCVGVLILFALSLAAHETIAAPRGADVWTAVLFMGLVGTPALFVLYVFVIRRWSVSATSYQFVIAPIVAIVLAAILLGERVTPSLLLGAPLVLAGVWIGALAPERRPAETSPAPPSA